MSVQAIASAFREPGLTSAEAFVLVALANYADHKMVCWPSHAALAKDTRLSRRRIISLLQSLEAKGAIKRKERFAAGRMTSALIMLTMRGETISPLVSQISQEGCNGFTGRGETTSHKPSIEPLREPLARDAPPAPEGAARSLVKTKKLSSSRPNETQAEMAARLRRLA